MRALIVVLLLFNGIPAAQALEAEASTPYDLEVVLSMGRHRLLTKIFQRQVQRELQDGLQAAFGDMVRVKVVLHHPRLKQVDEQGLGSLTTWQDLTQKKTHFVLINYRNGRYHIQARQHDGLTGLASPVVREASTTDRPYVARLATLLIDRDFGIVGTIPPGSNEKEFPIQLKGGKLREDLNRWVKKGDVFLLVPIRANQKTAVPVSDCVIRADSDPKDGVLNGRLFARRGKPLEPRSFIDGFRCIKLGTTSGPVRIRLVQYGSGDPAGNQRMWVRKRGFTGEADRLIDLVTDRDGYASTEQAEGKRGIFKNLAFVEVDTKPRRALIPVPIIDDKPVTLSINVKPRDALSRLESRRDLWIQDIRDSYKMLDGVFTELQKLLKKAIDLKGTVKRAQEGLDASKKSMARLNQEHLDLKAKAKEERQILDLTKGETALKNIVAAQKKLETFIDDQKKALKESNDPKQKAWKAAVAEAKLEEQQLNFDKALEIYDRILKEGLKDPTTKKHRDELRAKWTPKNAAHEDARDFVYRVWPGLDIVNDFTDKQAEAKTALETLKTVDDKITAEKFYRVTDQTHIETLSNAQKKLDPNRIGDEELGKKLIKIVKDLGELQSLADRIRR